MSERNIFVAALHESGAARAAFLDGACAGDAVLRARVEGLLDEYENLGTFLEAPAAAIAETASLGPAAHSRPHAAAHARGDLLGGRYKLLEEIGEGGMGSVWMAEQTEPVRRKVAVKLIKVGMASDQVL